MLIGLTRLEPCTLKVFSNLFDIALCYGFLSRTNNLFSLHLHSAILLISRESEKELKQDFERLEFPHELSKNVLINMLSSYFFSSGARSDLAKEFSSCMNRKTCIR